MDIVSVFIILSEARVFHIYIFCLPSTVDGAFTVSWYVSSLKSLTVSLHKIRKRTYRQTTSKPAVTATWHTMSEWYRGLVSVVPLSAHIGLPSNLITSVGQNDGRWLVELTFL